MRNRSHSSRSLFSVFLVFLSLCFFTSAASAADLTLAWDANLETDLAGYRVYYKTGGSGAPYDGTGLDQGDAGIDLPLDSLDNPASPQITLTGLAEDTAYFLAVTAYNQQGSESGYSNEVSYTAPSAVTTHTITATAGTGGSISPAGTATVTQGIDQTFSIIPDAGYHIADVLVDGTSVSVNTTYAVNPADGSASPGTSTYTFSNITADHTISASFAVDTHTITVTAGEHGTISPSGILVMNHGADQTFGITPDTGYHVVDVLVDNTSVGAVLSYTFDNISTDHSLSAVFEMDAVSYTITATAGPGGSISPQGATTVDSGTDKTFSITSETGYHLADVLVDGKSVGAQSAYTFSSVDADHEIEVSFAADTFTITASAGENGSITPEGETVVQSGGDQTFTFTPADGCTVKDVLVDGTSAGAVTSYTFSEVTGNHTIAASFAAPSPPSADAGPDQTVDEGVMVTLNGGNSFDLDDGIKSFQWEQVGGPTVELASPQEPETAFLAPDVDPNGTALVFRLNVSDYSGAVSTDTCIINVTWLNMPPIADAGPDTSVDEGSTVTLNALKSSDADDGIATYQWIQTAGIAVQLSDPAAATPGFSTPDIGPSGAALAFELTVTDNGGLQAQDTCIVNVCGLNKPPTAEAGPDQKADKNATVTLDGSESTDPDDGIALYHWKQTAGTPVTLSDATAVRPALTLPADASDSESLNFTLTVTDTSGLQNSDTCSVSVQASNVDPISPLLEITGPTNEPTYTTTGKEVDLSGNADSSVGISRVIWQNSRTGSGGTASGTTQWTITGIKLKGGANAITVTAVDTAGKQESQTITVYRVGR